MLFNLKDFYFTIIEGVSSVRTFQFLINIASCGFFCFDLFFCCFFFWHIQEKNRKKKKRKGGEGTTVYSC